VQNADVDANPVSQPRAANVHVLPARVLKRKVKESNYGN